MNQDRLSIQMKLREAIKEALYYHKRLQNMDSYFYDYNFDNCMWWKQEARKLINDLRTLKVNS